MNKKQRFINHFLSYFIVHGMDFEISFSIDWQTLEYDYRDVMIQDIQNPGDYRWIPEKYRAIIMRLNVVNHIYYLSLPEHQMKEKNNFILNYHKRLRANSRMQGGSALNLGLRCPICGFKLNEKKEE